MDFLTDSDEETNLPPPKTHVAQARIAVDLREIRSYTKIILPRNQFTMIKTSRGDSKSQNQSSSR